MLDFSLKLELQSLERPRKRWRNSALLRHFVLIIVRTDTPFAFAIAAARPVGVPPACVCQALEMALARVAT